METTFSQKSDAKKQHSPSLNCLAEASFSSETEQGATAGMPLFLQRLPVQPKLVVGQPNDPLEQEADRVAERVQSGSHQSAQTTSTEADSVQRKCAKCEEKVQAKSLGTSAASSSSLPLPDAGSALSEEVRSRVEPVLGTDLSHVRVHSSPSAQATAKDLNAKAFTHKNHIWLGANQSPNDIALLSHEVTHVVQQTGQEEGSSLVQRVVADPAVEDGAEVQRRLRQRIDEALGDRTPNQTPDQAQTPASPQTASTPATPVPDPEARRSAQQIDRTKLSAKTSEVQPDARPPIDRAAEQQPEVDQAAQETNQSLDEAAEQKPEGKEEKASDDAKAGKGGKRGADQVASAADQAFAQADSQPMPDQPIALIPPPPVVPVDAGGTPLPPTPELDMQIFELADRAQMMQDQGQNVRAQATEGKANTQLLRGNIQLIQQSVRRADTSIETAQGNLEYRQGGVTQARQALQVSEQKAATVGQQAPQGVSQAAEGKEKSTPLVSESRDLSSENSANAPDDSDAAARSQEQGSKLNQVGSDAATVDNTLTQVHDASNTLVEDAAHATQVNTQTRAKVDAIDGNLQQAQGGLDQMREHSSQAKNQVESLQNQPSVLGAQSSEMDSEGKSLMDASTEIGTRLHQAQQNHAQGLRSVPAPEEVPEEAPEGELIAPETGSTLPPEANLPEEMPDLAAPDLASAAPVAETPPALETAPSESQPSMSDAASSEEVVIQREPEAATAAPINVTSGLPSWFTGEPEPNAQQRQEAQDREIARRQNEIAEINAIAERAGGFEKLGHLDRMGIAFRLAMRNTFGGLSGISWPGLGGIASGAGHLAVSLIDPRAPLMGVLSGVNMIANGVANFARNPSWIGGLRLAATIATGLTVILGSITALAGVIAAIMTAITILSLGTAAPITGPIIAFCATIMTTVGGWTFWVGLIAAGLQALTFVADLWQASTAQNAEQLQQHSDSMAEDTRNFGNSLLQAGMGRLAQVGGRQMQSAIAESGGGVAFARSLGRGNPIARAAQVARRVPGSRVGALGRASVFARSLGRSTSRGLRGMFRGLRSGIQKEGGLRSFVGRELRQFGRELRTGTPKVFRDRRAFSREFLVGDGRPVPPGALQEGVLGEMQSAGRNLRQIVEGGHSAPRADAEGAIPGDREAPAPRREEGVADIGEATPESAPTRETSVRDSGHIESDQLSSQQLRNEVDHINNHPELVEGTPPNRTAKIGNHEWHEQPGGRWCRHSGEQLCLPGIEAPNPPPATPEPTPTETPALTPDEPITGTPGTNAAPTPEATTTRIRDTRANYAEVLNEKPDLRRRLDQLSSRAQNAARAGDMKEAAKIAKDLDRLERQLVERGVVRNGQRFTAEPELLEGRKHGLDWEGGPNRLRDELAGGIYDAKGRYRYKPQGQFASMEDIHYAVQKGAELGPAAEGHFPLPPGSKSFVWALRDEDIVRLPARVIFVKVRENGVVHAYPALSQELFPF